VAGFVHWAMGDPGSHQAFRPPAMHRGRRELFEPVLPNRPKWPAVELRAAFLRVEQELVRRRSAVEDVSLEDRSELFFDDRQVAHLPALTEHGQVAPVVVLELDPGKFALA